MRRQPGTSTASSPTSAQVLEVKNLFAGYGRFKVLHDVSMTVGADEVVGVLGANGAGKTTLLRAISGIIPATGGEIWLRSQRVDGRPAYALTRDGIGHVPSGRELFPELSVDDTLTTGAYAVSKQRARELRVRVLDLFPALGNMLGRQAGALSGGQQQMLAVGRALMTDPHLLLLDEPSTGLAPNLVASLFEALREMIKDGGMSVIVVEQNVSLALSLAKRAYVLQHGRFVLSGAAEELHGDVLAKAYLGG